MRMKEQKVTELILNSVFSITVLYLEHVCEYFDEVLSSPKEQSLLFYAEGSIWLLWYIVMDDRQVSEWNLSNLRVRDFQLLWHITFPLSVNWETPNHYYQNRPSKSVSSSSSSLEVLYCRNHPLDAAVALLLQSFLSVTMVGIWYAGAIGVITLVLKFDWPINLWEFQACPLNVMNWFELVWAVVPE